jgi:hypothetical protein
MGESSRNPTSCCLRILYLEDINVICREIKFKERIIGRDSRELNFSEDDVEIR